MLKIAILTKRKDHFLKFVNNIDKNKFEIYFYKNKDDFISIIDHFDFIIFDSSTIDPFIFYDLIQLTRKEKIIYLSQYFDYEEFRYFLKNDLNILFKPLQEYFFYKNDRL
ncbi:MAG: hypothetical protein N3A58_07355 [Spirochaetes bacterium]|nr:hypothetical protein [Spirochaetota bacterium]